jgi:hypothetical protein
VTTALDNPALVLRDILRSLARGSALIRVRWEELLGAAPGTHLFAMRHSDVIGVWKQVNDLLLGLRETDDARTQYLAYMPRYYEALVFQGDWARQPSEATSERMVVDHLTGIATMLQYRGLANPALSGDAIDRLKASITEWRGIIAEAMFDEKFATELNAQVNHLEWLLDNVSLLGSRPVVEASQKLVGASVVAMGKKPSFAKRIGRATAAFVAAVTVFHTVVDETAGMIDGVKDLRDSVVELVSPQKELEAPKKPKELPAGSSTVVEGGVVADNPPESPTPEEGAQG